MVRTERTHTPPRIRTSRTDRRRLAARAQGGDNGVGMGKRWECGVFEWGVRFSGGVSEIFDYFYPTKPFGFLFSVF
jgi:hypothetical protein